MARVTVEDCIEKVHNRFKLVLMAAQRAKDIASGARPSVQKDNDKASIIALREIAEEAISLEGLEMLAKKKFTEDPDLPSDDDVNDAVLLSSVEPTAETEAEEEDEDETLDDDDMAALQDIDAALGEGLSIVDEEDVDKG
jgi:DNA-directed RNA polymerase subunit omega